MVKKKDEEKTKIFTIISFVLFIFFILPQVHDWANSTSIKLHFCNHIACFFFSLIFLSFTYIGYKHLKKKKEIKDSWIGIAIVVLIVGIFLMNMTVCDSSGNMYFSFDGETMYMYGESDVCKPGTSCEVPTPPCLETDDGQDYKSYGEILSGANVEDICLANDNLRERYCNSELTYTSEDIDCAEEYGENWLCEEGECRYSTAPPPDTEDTSALCSDGLDNDDDGSIDCEDTDCSDDFCECGHGSLVEPPECGGRCPTGEYCAEYVTDSSSWCECVPDGETPCGSSNPNLGIDCDGWCLDTDFCVHDYDSDNCYCNSWHCIDSDGGYYPEVAGCVYWEDIECDYCNSQDELIELTCTETEPYYNEVDCTIFGDNYVCLDSKFGSYCGVSEP